MISSSHRFSGTKELDGFSRNEQENPSLCGEGFAIHGVLLLPNV